MYVQASPRFCPKMPVNHMNNPSDSEDRGWKRISILVPLITAALAFGGGWYANSQQGKQSEADRLLRVQELEQQRREHAETVRIQRYEIASKFLPYLRDENPEVRNVALKAVRELGVMPVAADALDARSVTRLSRPRSPRDSADTQRNVAKLAQDSLLPAEDLRLSLRSDTVPVGPDSAVSGRRAFGLWRAADGTYWVGGTCSPGQQCATITP